MNNMDSLARWIAEHWRGDQQRWFQSLVDADLIGVDWPAPFGGGWQREDQYTFVSLLVERQCPLMPESVTVIAPLILQYGSESQKQTFLPSIRRNPLAWSLHGETPNRCWLASGDDGTDTLMIADASTPAETLGKPGAGITLLAQAVSPLWLLQEYFLGLGYLQQADVDESKVVSELRLQADVLNAHFLRDNAVTDAQLALLVTRSRLTLYSELFSALGYYALIDPPAMPGDNEPVPFAAEREHLRALRTLTSRDEMVQQDQIYSEHLALEDSHAQSD